MLTSKINFLISGILLLILLFVFGFLTYQNGRNQRPAKHLEITLSDVKTQAFGLIYIAVQEGFFAQQNLTVNFRTFAMTQDALEDVVNGNSDLATVSEIPFIRGINSGQDLSIISSLHKSKNNTAIVAFKKNKINGVQDLKGKKIATTQGSNNEFLIYYFLSLYNIQPKNVKIIYANATTSVQMFKDGNVDAVSTSNPYLLDILNTYPSNELTTMYSDTYIENSFLAGKTSNIVAKQEAVSRFLKALSQAETFSKTHKEQSITDITASLQNISEETVANLWDDYNLTLSLDNVVIEILNKQQQVFQEVESHTKNNIDFRKIIFIDYLQKIKPEDVTLFK